MKVLFFKVVAAIITVSFFIFIAPLVKLITRYDEALETDFFNDLDIG